MLAKKEKRANTWIQEEKEHLTANSREGVKKVKNWGFKEALSKVKEDQVKRAVEDKDPDP